MPVRARRRLRLLNFEQLLEPRDLVEQVKHKVAGVVLACGRPILYVDRLSQSVCARRSADIGLEVSNQVKEGIPRQGRRCRGRAAWRSPSHVGGSTAPARRSWYNSFRPSRWSTPIHSRMTPAELADVRWPPGRARQTHALATVLVVVLHDRRQAHQLKTSRRVRNRSLSCSRAS